MRGLEITDIEGFGHVMIRPEVRTVDAVFGGGHYHLGAAVALRPLGARNRKAVRFRQIETKNPGAELRGCNRVPGSLAVTGGSDRLLLHGPCREALGEKYARELLDR